MLLTLEPTPEITQDKKQGTELQHKDLVIAFTCSVMEVDMGSALTELEVHKHCDKPHSYRNNSKVGPLTACRELLPRIVLLCSATLQHNTEMTSLYKSDRFI